MNKIYELNKSFDSIENKIEKEREIDEYIVEYANLKNKLSYLKNKIDEKIKDTEFYFDEDSCLLLEKKHRGIFLNYYFKIFNKDTSEWDVFSESNQFDEDDFEEIKKYLKNDKEKICEFLNNKELLKKYDPLASMSLYISKLFCGICSTNNIVKIIESDYKKGVIYSVKLSQIEYGKETFLGEIMFLISDKDKAIHRLKELLNDWL